MKWGLLMTLATLMVAHSAHGDELADLVLVGGTSGDTYELRQVRKAETDVVECRKSYAHYRTNYSDNPRLADLLIRRRCTLFDEVAKEKRRAYEQRKRVVRANQMRGEQ
jgi:hypothetical protein